MSLLRSLTPRPAAVLAGTLALAGFLASCEGSNGWTDLPTGTRDSGSVDSAPTVDIQAPDSARRLAVGDSLLVRVRLLDDAALDSLVLTGYALRGSAELGTQVRVQRFATKVVELRKAGAFVRDTTINRYLLATSDSLPEGGVYIVAAARDTAGNVRADTVRIAIGGPRVQILSPAAQSEVRAGTELRVRVSATDSIHRIQAVRLVTSGAFTRDTTLRLDPVLARVDTLIVLPVPSGSTGELRLQALARSMSNDSAVSAPTALRVLAASRDQVPPSVSFSVAVPARAERNDTVAITVAATDSTAVGRIGATIRPIHRLADRTEFLPALRVEAQGRESGVFRFALSRLGLPEPMDTSRLRLEVTAFAVDTAGNCATSTIAGTPLSQPCRVVGDTIFSNGTGARSELLLVRGNTIRPSVASDRLVDLVADAAGQRLFVSNHSRNQVEILPFAARDFGRPIAVGSEPWGLAVGTARDTLYVANSGGTNISVVPLATLAESRRIRTPDIRLFGVSFTVTTDSATAVVERDYSDRPQFLGQISSGQLIYSTKPTATRADGTIRIYDPAKDPTLEANRVTEVFVNYAARAEGKGIVVNALDASLAPGGRITVCPRRVSESQSDPACVTSTPTGTRDAVAALRAAGLTDTRVELGVEIGSIGLSDTTFVAVSRDHSTIAFGEGAVDPGRIFLFRNVSGALRGSSAETADLVGNAAERVISLGLNGDGSLGVARGRQAYFFENDLRLQGIAAAGAPAGGSTLHPLNVDYPTDQRLRRAFVSGVDAAGASFIDVIDVHSFRSLRRVYIRDRVTGTVVAVAVTPDDPASGTLAVRLFAITGSGVVQVGLSEADLQ